MVIKATGFKSMVVAQFTGIGLQKDDNAFVLYDNNLWHLIKILLFLEMRLSVQTPESIFKPELS
jgi:hypothetical protein